MKEAGKGPREHPEPIRKDSTLVGRRMWVLARDRTRYRLTNIANATDEYWPRGVYEADCVNWHRHPDRTPSPHPDCACGLYAFWTWEELVAQRDGHHGMLTGIVQGWGRVVPGVQGFKSQFMQPVAIDWPMCAGQGDPLVMKHSRCLEPSMWLTAHDPEWLPRYPREGDEDWQVGYEWVDCRITEMHWRCDKHQFAKPQQGEEAFTVMTSTVMEHLAAFYEVDIMPVQDFTVDVNDEEGDGWDA